MRNRNVPLWIKKKAHDECILPVLTYGSETWSISATKLQKLVTTQRKMERIMLGLTLRDRKKATWIRQKTGVTDIIQHIRSQKHRWAGHICRMRDNRWTIRVTEWYPRPKKRPRGRPKRRWNDDLCQALGTNWSQMARDRLRWKQSREGFLSMERDTP